MGTLSIALSKGRILEETAEDLVFELDQFRDTFSERGANEIMKVVEKQSLTSRQLEKRLDITQSRASELLNGKISQMTADRLTKYLYRLGRQVKVTTTRATLQGTEVA